MGILVYSAVLASALLHAVWNAILKRQDDPEVAAAGMFLVCAAAGLVMVVALPGRAFATPAAAGWSVASGAFEAGYILTLSRALARAPLGPVYTVSRGGALLLVWPVSILLLDERLTPAAAVGSALVALGLATTGLGARGARRVAAGGLALAALCAACIAAYHLCYKQALALGGAPPAVFAVSLGLAGPLNVARLPAAARRRLGALRARPWPIVAGGLLASGSFTIFLFALVHGGAGAVLTLRNTSILFAQGLSFAIGERPTRAGVVGAVVVTAGAILLGL